MERLPATAAPKVSALLTALTLDNRWFSEQPWFSLWLQLFEFWLQILMYLKCNAG